MTIKKKVLVLITALVAGLATSAHAAGIIEEADLILGDNYVNINGVGFENVGEDVTVLVLKNAKTIDNYTNNDVERQAQLKINENGEFNLNFKLNESDISAPEYYTAYITVGSEEKVSEFVYSPVNSDNIIQSSNANTYLNRVRTAAGSLNLNNTAYAGFTGDATNMRAVINMTWYVKDSITDSEDLKDALALASAIQAINVGRPELVFSGIYPVNSGALGVEKDIDGTYSFDEMYGGTAAQLFAESIDDEGKESIINALTSKTYTSIDEYVKEFVLQTTIYAIKNNVNNSTSHIRSILEDNKDLIGIVDDVFENYTSNQATIDVLLINGTYTDKEGLLAVLNTTVEGGVDKDTKPEPSRPSDTTNGTPFSPTITVVGGVEVFVFTDVTENYEWAKDAIKELYEAGIISGKSSNTFAPAAKVTRAEFLKILMGVMGIEAQSGTSEFNDVNTSDWYHNYVVTATKLGLVNGISETEFGANKNITRQDACVMISRACEITGNTLIAGTAMEFDDADFVAEYARESVNLLSGAGIVQGSNNLFSPRANCTRAEAAVMLKNVLDKIEG